jgi:hypothetical protein
LTSGLNVDKSLHDRVRASTFERSSDGQFILSASPLFDALHNRENNFSLLALFTSNGPNARIVHTREEQSLGNNRCISEAFARTSITISLSQDLCLFLGVHAGIYLATAIELTMSSVIIDTSFSHIVWMIVCDKVAYLFTQHLVIFGFVFIVDFGFDIEESCSSFLSALSAMALKGVSI